MSSQGPSYQASRSGAGPHDRSASAGTGNQSYGSQSRRVASTSSVASSTGTAYSSARGSVATSAGGTKASAAGMAAHLETTVTKLLVATKQLLEGLTDWSQGRITEEQVSDIYVRLGNCFNAAVAAFTKEGISMRDLKEVPQLLRVRLEDAINEDASRETLNKHLPRIRPIVLDLLRGLRQKQEQHAAMIAASGQTDLSVSPPAEGLQHMQQQQQQQYARRPSGNLGPGGPAEPVASTSGSRRPSQELGARNREDNHANGYHYQSSSGRVSPAPSVGASSGTSRPHSRNSHNANASYNDGNASSDSLPGRRPSHEEGHRESTRRPSGPHRRPGSLLKSSSSSSSLRPSSRNETHPPDAPLPPLPQQPTAVPSDSSQGRGPLPMPDFRQYKLQAPREQPPPMPPEIRTVPPPGPPLPPPLPPLSPNLASTPPPSGLSTPPRSTLRPMNTGIRENDEASLEALKKADPLARRASKRFSAYTFNKISSSTSIAGSPSSAFASTFPGTPRGGQLDRDNSARDFVNANGHPEASAEQIMDNAQRQRSRGKSTSPKSRHREIEPPVPALPPMASIAKMSLGPEEGSSQPRKKRVSVVAEETEDELAADANDPQAFVTAPPAKAENKALKRISNEDLLRTARSGSAVSIASSVSQYSNQDADISSRRPSVAPEPQGPGHRTVFLQLGRDMKKAKLIETEEPTVASLRMLFTERFAYNPGMTDFPAIYLRDPHSGVQYELEDMSEIKDNSVLSLNIEPLDQVKQHIDDGLAALTRELKELKASMNKRISSSPAPAPLQSSPLTPGSALGLSPPSRPPPSDAQLQQAAQNVIQMKRKLSSGPPEGDKLPSELASPAASVSSHSEAKVQKLAAELRASYDEVQSVRREVGALRQVYSDFKIQTAGVLSALRAQASHVREIATTKVAGERAYIDDGKVKLDNRSQDLLTKIEELQDAIDDLKNDVVNRRIKPKPKQMETIKASIAAGQSDLNSLGQYIATVKPMWKKTWEAELQNIVDEQQLLVHQEELLSDLQADHENVVTVFGQIEQYLSLQISSRPRKSEFRPPSPDEGHEGLKSVMMEVKGLNPASDKRMKAIEMAEKTRQKEAAGKSDDFAQELSGFVEGKLLKRTGGAEETERIRQLKSEASLRAMYKQAAAPPPPPSMPPSAPARVASNGSLAAELPPIATGPPLDALPRTPPPHMHPLPDSVGSLAEYAETRNNLHRDSNDSLDLNPDRQETLS